MLGLQACAVAMTGCLASFLLIGYHKIISKLKLLEWVTGIVRLINNILSIDWCLGCFNYMDSIKLNQKVFFTGKRRSPGFLECPSSGCGERSLLHSLEAYKYMVKQLITLEKAMLERKKEQAVLYAYGWIVQLVQFRSKSLSELSERFFFLICFIL